MSYYVLMIVKAVVAILLAILFGNGSVVAFNRMPVRWFEDEDEKENKILPEELRDMGDGSRQRLHSTPWKFVFTGYFGVVGVFLALHFSLQYEVAALCALVITLLMAICDGKYRLVPDFLSILLAISAIGFISFQDPWWSPLVGVLAGSLVVLIFNGIGKLVYKKDIIGGADLKFFAAVGLIAGGTGTIVLFVLTNLLVCLHAIFLLATGRIRKGSYLPMLPYAFVALTIYFLFLWDILPVLLG